jgi:glycosyltransferase involved in cell wall biosynthesis
LEFSNPKISVLNYEDSSDIVKGMTSGPGPVRNYAVSKADTEWVAFLDDDDSLTEDYVSRLSEEGEGADKPVKQSVSIRSIDVTGAPQVLETVEDIEMYLSALRTALLSTISDAGKRIAL